jgi:hypothetical protein
MNFILEAKHSIIVRNLFVRAAVWDKSVYFLGFSGDHSLYTGIVLRR